MFKFNIIEPNTDIFEKNLTDLIKKGNNFIQERAFILENKKNIRLILAEEKDQNLRGGACLLRKRTTNVPEAIRELLPTIVLDNGYVWECSRIYFEVFFSGGLSENSEMKIIFQKFYQGLYEEMANFGKKKGVELMIVKLETDMYISTEIFGSWPYIVRLNYKTTTGQFFYGILPLKGREYELYCDCLDNEKLEA